MRLINWLFLMVVLCEALAMAECSVENGRHQDMALEDLSRRRAGSLVDWQQGRGLFARNSYQGKLKFTSVFDQDLTRNVSFLYFQAKGDGPRPLVLVLSPLGGSNPLDSWIAENLARYGISSVVSYYRQPSEDHEMLKNTYRDTIENLQAQMTVTDWFADREEVDPDRLGILGISFGGIRAGFLMGLDPRLRAATLVVTGAGFADVMAESQLEAVAAIRRQQMLTHGISDVEDYRRIFRDRQRVTLADLLCEQRPEKFLLFLDHADQSVPSTSQERLLGLLGNPEVQWTSRGHIRAAVSFGAMNVKKAVRFYERGWLD